MISISLENADLINLKIIDISGKQVYSQRIENGSFKNIELPLNLNGVYFIIIKDKNDQRLIQKIRIIN